MNSFLLLLLQISSEKKKVVRSSTPKLQITRINTVATALVQILHYCKYYDKIPFYVHMHVGTHFHSNTATSQPPQNLLGK